MCFYDAGYFVFTLPLRRQTIIFRIQINIENSNIIFMLLVNSKNNSLVISDVPSIRVKADVAMLILMMFPVCSKVFAIPEASP